MRNVRILFASTVFPGLLLCATASLPSHDTPLLRRLSPADLTVTEGALQEEPPNLLSVNVSKMRAVATIPTQQKAEIRFQYRGPVKQAVPLGSGERRCQIALKLRAQDPCNLLYVSWRIAPSPGLVVSLKLNPGMQQSAECENGGYQNIKPLRSTPPPPLGMNQWHRLHAELDESELRVQIDGRNVWEGYVGDAALQLHGPVGVRTDNGRFVFELFAAPRPNP